ncbi:Biotin synthesis protein bioH [Methylophaga frappieri]|uniref:Pimeloyl-[acyl-carrier protein] methyl ester esterase n=1 Tax=Methylophaga frappieri (strain ATCC BAA-2434 / DSM 25690 / JAM7) TaxID=754477 RepID=I1YHS2_METFJ|nr:pimeloyl-ACP methyl ester esterase BioH [Methylophaga frappieri]AFJ02465.1 Biotin synthesis protein bioH [Methylophaga frappieri]
MFIEVTGQGPDMVLVHGWSMNRHVWQPIKSCLENDFTLHCVDLPGHGDSDWQEGDFAAERLLAQLAKQLPSNAIWVGWSLGGLIALQFAHAFPQRVSQLIMLAATPKFVADATWHTAMPARNFADFSDALDRDPQQVMQSFLLLQARGAQQARETIRQLQTIMIQTQHAHPSALTAGLSRLEKTDARTALAELAMPVGLLLGAQDNLIPSSLAVAAQQLNPDLQCQIIDGAGHAPFLSHPAPTLAFIREQVHD